MYRIRFPEALTALEIRDPFIHECERIAGQAQLFAKFDQPQQQVFARSYGDARHKNRVRVGNGNHKSWRIDFQTDPPQTNRPNVIGRIAIHGPVNPAKMEFGGFDYGKWDKPAPTYSYIDLTTPEIRIGTSWETRPLSRELFEACAEAGALALTGGQLELFN